MELLQINKFAELHDGKLVRFCRTDHLAKEFREIRKLKHEVVLISGNSDESIGASQLAEIPDNISRWYCQNLREKHEKLQVIPLGLENTFPCKRKGHGVGWPHAVEKLEILSKIYTSGLLRRPANFIYSNFNERTNPSHRGPVKKISKVLQHVTWEEPTLNYQEFVHKVLDHEAVICPAGNGTDTHRIYEVLYCGRVAVTFKIGDSPLYTEIYGKLPVVILDNIEELADSKKLEELIKRAQQKVVSTELLDYGYWRSLITSSAPAGLKKKDALLRRIFNMHGRQI